MNEKRSSGELEATRLEGLYRKAADPVLRTHLLMVWRMSVGDSRREVAERVGYSERWVREIARRYGEGGVEGLGDRRHSNPGGGRGELLDGEGRGELRGAILSGVPPGGGMWSGPKVALWVAGRAGKGKVHAQRGWEYLRRVGMSPQAPRPANVRADDGEKAAFEKGSPSG